MEDVSKRPLAGGEEARPVSKRARADEGMGSRAAKGAPAHKVERLPAAISRLAEAKVEPMLSTDSGASTPPAEPPGKADKGKRPPAAGAKRKPGRGKQAAAAGNGHVVAASCGHQLQETRTTRGAVPGLAEAAASFAAASPGGDGAGGEGSAQSSGRSGISSTEALSLLEGHRVPPFLPPALAREIDGMIAELRVEAKEEAEAKRLRLAAQAHAYALNGGSSSGNVGSRGGATGCNGNGGSGGGGSGRDSSGGGLSGGGGGGGDGRLSANADRPQPRRSPGLTAAARRCVLSESGVADAAADGEASLAQSAAIDACNSHSAHNGGAAGPSGVTGTGGAAAGAGAGCASSSAAGNPDLSCREDGDPAAPDLGSAAPDLGSDAPDLVSAAPDSALAAPEILSAAPDLGCRGPLVEALERLRDTVGGNWASLGWGELAARLHTALEDHLPASPPGIVPAGGGGEPLPKSRVCSLRLSQRTGAAASRLQERLSQTWERLLRRAVGAYNVAAPIRGQGLVLSAAMQAVYAMPRFRDYCVMTKSAFNEVGWGGC
jgi:hypothetical protein